MGRTLAGKVALVTGGSRGIGAAIVRALGGEGGDVAFSYGSSPSRAEELVKELQAQGIRAACYQADQMDTHQAEGSVEKVVQVFGRLDVLVNNAGVAVGGKVAHVNGEAAALDRMQAINYAAAAVFLAGPSASYVTGSVFAVDGGFGA